MRPSAALALCLAATLAATPARAAADEPELPAATTAGEDALSILVPRPHAAHNPLTKRSRDYRGLPFGDWMLYPSVLVGGVADSNLVWSERQPVRAAGVRISPRVIAERNVGLHKTTAYAEADARLFPTLAYGAAINAQVGLAHVWEVQRDLIVKARVQYDRKALHISGGAFALPGGGYALLATPLVADQGLAEAAIQKSFGRLFVGLSLDATRTLYHDLRTTGGVFPQSYRDSLTTRRGARGGLWISPALYAFGEAMGNLREISQADLSSRGYRLTAGLGSDRLSLFRGEIFAGLQRQHYQ